MPYEHKQPKHRKGNHPVVQQIRNAGAQADKNSGWCAILLVAMLVLPASAVAIAVYAVGRML